eukprot:jgi/Chlat1/3198/Chrsp22S03488
MDLWAAAAEEVKATKARPDPHLYCVGAAGAGKSTLLQRFTEGDDRSAAASSSSYKPTHGLSYSYARHNTLDRRDVAHIWEVGGGPAARWERCLLAPAAFACSCCVIVLDLSRPGDALGCLLEWLAAIKGRIAAIVKSLSRHGSRLPDQVLARAQRLFGPAHEDKDAVTLSPVPIVMARALRFVAHLHGASLLYTSGLTAVPSSTDPKQGAQLRALMTAFRATLAHHLFNLAPCKVVERDYMNPLVVPAGADRFRDIGRPRGANADVPGAADTIAPSAQLPEWQALYARTFLPEEKSRVPRWVMDAALYAEPAVDVCRAQKEQELELLRAARKQEQQQQQLDETGNTSASKAAPKQSPVRRSSSRTGTMQGTNVYMIAGLATRGVPVWAQSIR